MYDMMPIIFGVMMIVLGLYMVKDPVHATKKSLRQETQAIAIIELKDNMKMQKKK